MDSQPIASDGADSQKTTPTGLKNLDNWLIFFVATYQIASIIACLVFLFLPVGARLLTHTINSTSPNFAFYRLSSSVAVAGWLGGSFYAATGLYRRLAANSEDRPSDFYREFNIKLWFFWYIFRPIQGSALAVIILALLNAGFVGLADLKSVNLQNLYFQVSLGFLVGYGTHEVLHKIDEIIKVTFATSKARDQSNVYDQSKKKVLENQDQPHLND